MKLRCKQCALENNIGICDRSDCINSLFITKEDLYDVIGTGATASRELNIKRGLIRLVDNHNRFIKLLVSAK